MRIVHCMLSVFLCVLLLRFLLFSGNAKIKPKACDNKEYYRVTQVSGETGNYQRSVSLPAVLYIAPWPYCYVCLLDTSWCEGRLLLRSAFMCAPRCARILLFICMPRSAKTASISIAGDRGALWPRVSNSNVSITVSQALRPYLFSIGWLSQFSQHATRLYNQKCWSASAPSGLRGAVQPAVTTSLYQLVFCDWVQVCGQSQCAYRTVTLPLCAELSWCAGYLWWCREVECAYLSPNIHGVT